MHGMNRTMANACQNDVFFLVHVHLSDFIYFFLFLRRQMPKLNLTFCVFTWKYYLLFSLPFFIYTNRSSTGIQSNLPCLLLKLVLPATIPVASFVIAVMVVDKFAAGAPPIHAKAKTPATEIPNGWNVRLVMVWVASRAVADSRFMYNQHKKESQPPKQQERPHHSQQQQQQQHRTACIRYWRTRCFKLAKL